MEKVKAFCKRKNIEISVKRYLIDALGAMAQGLFASLLIGTIISTLGILAFLDSWNQLVWPLILTKSSEMMTVQLALKTFKSEFGMKWNLVMAATFISIIPVVLVFLFFQKQIVEGIATSGLKG